MIEKPLVQLSGEDANVFSIIGRVAKALKKVGMPKRAEEFRKKAKASSSYDAVLQLCDEYVEVY